MDKRRRTSASGGDPLSTATSLINSLDDGCLMHIFSFLSPIPDRFKSALVCHRWRFLACHPRLWLRVERSIRTLGEPGVFHSIGAAVSAARPGDTILIAAGGHHVASNIQINKPLCIIGGGDLPDDTILTCSRGSDSALEFLSTCKVANLTCEENPLDYLSFAIVSTANGSDAFTPSPEGNDNSVTVASTRIEGGAKAVGTRGSLVLQHVRAVYARTTVLFWFEVREKKHLD